MKTCFVIMGFGKKMDYQTGKLVDLDLVYQFAIKPLFDKEKNLGLNYQVIRGDEILTSQLIDIEMYRLLLDADIVIADITTYNPNALYELGVRHALRPASTIIIAQNLYQGAYPFDLNHCRIFSYENFETDGKDSITVRKLQNKLADVISHCSQDKTDSPIYSYLKDLCPPKKIEGETENFGGVNIMKKQADELSRVVHQITNAKDAMKDSDFNKAIPLWESLHKEIPHYPYVIQQLALATYKSEQPTTKIALEQGWKIINELNIDTTIDTETLGIAGAICKRLYLETKNNLWLEKAMKYYNKGFINSQDYYTGENYANCLLLKMQQDTLEQENKFALNYLRKETCKRIITILNKEERKGKLDKWELATMSNCYLHLQNEELAEKYQQQFIKTHPSDWEIETFNTTKEEIKTVLEMYK